MKKSKKIMLSVGAITALATPIAIASTTIKSNLENSENKNINTPIFTQGFEGYGSASNSNLIAPNVKPLTDVDGTLVGNGFMTQTSDGTIYVGTEKNGLMKLENGKLVSVDKTDVHNGFMKEFNGTIYVATYSKGLMKLENGKLVSVDGADVGNGFMTQTSDGTIYVGTYFDGLMKLENGKLKDVDKTYAVREGFMTQTSDGTIYVGTDNDGLKKLVNGKLEDVDGTDVSYGFMTQTSDGTIYVGTEKNGLMKLENGKLVSVDKTNVHEGFMKEINGTKYVGTFGKGLMKLVNGKLISVDGTDVSYGFMTQTSDGTIYVGTNDKGLTKFDFAKVAKTNEDFVKTTYNGIEINDDPTKSLKEIVGEIKDTVSLESSTGIKLPKMNFSTIGTIKATLDKNGKIDLEIEVKTQSGIVNIVKTKLSYTATQDRINEIQKRNIDRIKAKFRRAGLIKQGGRTVDEVNLDIVKAGSIQDKIQKIKDETGIDLGQGLESPTTITNIIVTKKADGAIQVKVNTNTPNATTPDKPIIVYILSERDAIIAKIIEKGKKDIVDKLIKDKVKSTNNNSLNLIIGTKPIINQGTNSVTTIATEINKGSIDDRLNALKKWGKIVLPKTKDGTTITGIKAIADPSKGTIALEVTTDTAGATNPTEVLKGKLTGKSDDTLTKEAKDKADKLAKQKADKSKPTDTQHKKLKKDKNVSVNDDTNKKTKKSIMLIIVSILSGITALGVIAKFFKR